jgi:hypothetical protein
MLKILLKTKNLIKKLVRFVKKSKNLKSVSNFAKKTKFQKM